MLLTALAFILVLGILIIAHELGHFVAAKLSGVKVLEFAVGFPPRLLSFKKKETQYTIGALPLGGYVKMLGEEDVSQDPRSFGRAKPWKRLIISIAGVAMNVVLAWIILTIGFSVGMSSIATDSASIPGKIIKSEVVLAGIEKDSAAEKADLKAGDVLESGSINGAVTKFTNSAQFDSYSSDNAGKTIDLVVKRNNDELTKSIAFSGQKDEALGVALADNIVVRVPWYKAPIVALRETYSILKVTAQFFQDFVHQIFTHGTVSQNVGGPVAIYVYTGMAVKAGWMIFIQYIALLSINLAFINILPFPALDGGRALFIILESIFRRRVVKEEIENIIHLAGFVVLILLVILITYRDVLHYIIH